MAKKKTTKETNDESMIKVETTNDGKIIKIPFDKVFDQPIAHTNEFNLSIKRNFYLINSEDVDKAKGKGKTQVHNISNDLEYILNHVDYFVANYLYIKVKIIERLEDYTEDKFIDDIFDNIIDDKFVEIVSDYVDERYTINLDENTTSASSKNEELQFTDQHGKIILKAAFAARVLVPIIAEYINYYPTKNYHSNDDIFFKVNERLFPVFQPKNINISNKIFKLINARIVAKCYSDRVILAYLLNMSKDKDTMAREFYRSIIANIIPKIKNNTNVVSFIHTVIKFKIKFEFKKNYKYSYKPIENNESDTDESSEFERMTANLLRADEGTALIKTLTVDQAIKIVGIKFGINITQDEFEYYKTIIKSNPNQNFYVGQFFAKYLGSYDTLFTSQEDQYIIMVIITYKWMKMNKMPILAEYLISTYEGQNERRTLHKKQFITQLTNSKQFNDLLHTKYNYVIEKLISSKLIIEKIAILIANKFRRNMDYDEYLENGGTINDDCIEFIEEKNESIAIEFINFISHV